MKMKWMLVAAAVVSAATMVSAQGAYQPSYKGVWSKDAEYRGDYTTYQGDTVQWKEVNGKKLYWWAKFYSKDDEPGALGTGGGTSPWVMINSISAANSNNGRPNYVWSGWDGNAAQGSAKVATWRYGVKGAYSMTFDDFGGMPWGLSIKPAYDLSKESGFEEIKQAWGIIVGKMDDTEWDQAIMMVAAGHEMFNHSYDHTSAGDQYQWFYNKQTIPDFDPSIPYAVRGLTVKSLWGQTNWPAPWAKNWDVPGGTPLATHLEENTGQTVGECTSVEKEKGDPIRRLTLEDSNIKIQGAAYWHGMAFSGDKCFLGKVPMVITPKGNTKKVTLPSGMDVYVNYTREIDYSDKSKFPEDGNAVEPAGGWNTGTIYATTPAWHDDDMLKKYGEGGWEGGFAVKFTGTDQQGGVSDDQGVPGLIASIFTVKAWGQTERTRNMREANDKINEKLYNRIQNPGKHFAVGKKSEYFGYPFDAYSLETHAALSSNDIPQGRGGSKTPIPMLGDFFHPYILDFDAFWIDSRQWTPSSQGPGFVYPDNAHVWLGLNEMVDKIIEKKGYMTREFHAVPDIQGEAWFNTGASNTWALNSSAAGQGGWWGGITKNQLRTHFTYLKSKIDNHDLVVSTPSEVVKYRLTANATSSPNLTLGGGEHTLSVSFNMGSDMIAQQQEEISVIVGIPATSQLDVQYANDNTRPRLAPRKLNNDGSAWSVNFNPGKHTSVKLTPNAPFVEPEWQGPDTTGNSQKGGDDCNPAYQDCENSISKTKTKAGAFAFTGIQNGQINLRLTAGNYTVQLYNLQGRMISSANISAVNGVNATGLKTTNLAKGLFILNVKDAKGAAILQHKLMVK